MRPSQLTPGYAQIEAPHYYRYQGSPQLAYGHCSHPTYRARGLHTHHLPLPSPSATAERARRARCRLLYGVGPPQLEAREEAWDEVGATSTIYTRHWDKYTQKKGGDSIYYGLTLFIASYIDSAGNRTHQGSQVTRHMSPTDVYPSNVFF